MRFPPLLALLSLASWWIAPPPAAAVVFESGPVRPVALSPDGSRLFVANAPDGRLEILAATPSGLGPLASVAVGLEPVAVAVRDEGEVWVVNHLSDSVSIVDVAADPPRVRRTLLVGDEPRDVVFAGPGRGRAFVTTAHRGQASPVDPALESPGAGQADVWVFDASDPGPGVGGEPIAILTLFGDKPRALAVTPDGSTVYAAVFLSGNRTTTIPAAAVCDGGALAPPCIVEGREMPGGLPAPNVDADGVPGPEVGLIARQDPGSRRWLDELGRDWSNAALFDLPDRDVFAIDANATPPAETWAASGVGTVIFGMAVDPVSGALYVAGTEARNEMRLESAVRGHLHEARVTIVTPGSVEPRHLNKHIDYAVVPSPPGVAEASLATPVALAISADGSTLYVAAFGSSAVGVFDTAELAADGFVPDPAAHVAVGGGGPSGLALDEARGRLYVATRFDNGVSVIDLASGTETSHLTFHDPEPDAVRLGRPLLYDARATSSNGEASCAGCHVFGDLDGLAWDLGRADLSVRPNPLELLQTNGRTDQDFHPLKGPMTTQTLRGIATHGSMHWRGDRTGGDDPGGSVDDERAALDEFNGAFVDLMGRAASLTQADMDRLDDFILALSLPPNPHQQLDGTLTAAQAAARDVFLTEDCVECHALDPASGYFGTRGAAAVSRDEPQFMKIPHLRNLYQKVGRFFGGLFQPFVDPAHVGDQIRGFGFSHDGSAGRLLDPAADFLFAFPTSLASVVGQQVTLDAASGAAVGERIDLLRDRALAGDCDLFVKGVIGGEARGWVQDEAGVFVGDHLSDPSISDGGLRSLATQGGSALTYTCAPPGEGRRRGIDRDGDGALDGDERDAGTDPADATEFPGPAAAPSPFVVYRVRSSPGEPAFARRAPVRLAGALGDVDVRIVSLVGLGRSAVLGDTGAVPPASERADYRIAPARRGDREEILRDVRVRNGCMDLPVRILRRQSLFVPAALALDGGAAAAPEANDATFDHLRCRAAKPEARDVDGRKLPGMSAGIQVDVVDGFQARRYDLLALTRVCVPTAKGGEPRWLSGPERGTPAPLSPAELRDPSAVFACYRVRRARRWIAQAGCGPAVPGDRGERIRPALPPHASRPGVSVADQLGSYRVDTVGERELCLPSSVEIGSAG